HVPFGTPLTISAVFSGPLPPGWTLTGGRQFAGSRPGCQGTSWGRCGAAGNPGAPPDTRHGVPRGFRVQIYWPNGNSAGYTEISLVWCVGGQPLRIDTYVGQCG